MVLTPRTCCWAGAAVAARAATGEARTRPAAATKVRLCTAGDANWRANGERRALLKPRDAIVMGIGGGGWGLGMGRTEEGWRRANSFYGDLLCAGVCACTAAVIGA